MSGAPGAFAEAAGIYDETRLRLVPPFERLYRAAVDALGLAERPLRRVLDLGAGTGLLSVRIAQASPEAHFVLVDAAKPMLDRAAGALGDRADVLRADLRDELPPGPFDAVVSGLAVHHLDDREKRLVFGRIRQALGPGGVFVNAEQVLAATPALAAADAEWHRAASAALGATNEEWAAAEGRMSHDRCATVEDQLRWLREVGFEDVDCLFRERRFAVVFGRVRGC